MPRPTPDYIPDELKDFAASMGLTPKSLAEKHGLHPNRFYVLFGTPHTKLKAYIALADFDGKSLDEISHILKSGKFAQYLDDLMKRKGSKSVSSLARQIGVSEGFLRLRCTMQNGTSNGLSNYEEVAQRIGWSLDRLARLCVR